MIVSSKETEAQKNELTFWSREAMSGAEQETHTLRVILLRAISLAFATLSALPLHYPLLHPFPSSPLLLLSL